MSSGLSGLRLLLLGKAAQVTS